VSVQKKEIYPEPTVLDGGSTPMRSTRELRAFLMRQMEGVASGSVDPARVKGVTNIAQQIYNSLLIEVKVAKARAEIGNDAIKPVIFDE